ncbi:UNVERIFIED_CONTAM: hypothetical protein Sradi_6161600 [Sesamum radiatum]|uniref:CCHC-type domain-containing protein n=1 Tax=Sesamum radiatum TaxID=300843 RepID=A0AAW2KAR6_SESRA
MDRFGTSVVLTEEEVGGGTLPASTWEGRSTVESFIVVGCLLTPRAYRFDVLRMTPTNILRPPRRVTMQVFADNRFLLTFNHMVDRDRALDGGPWIFDRNLVILNSVCSDVNPIDVDLNLCTFHVHIHRLPLRMMTRTVAEYIGTRLGEFLESEHAQAHFLTGSKLCIWVRVDIRRPLKWCLIIRSPKGDKLTVSFTYERLPMFCYACGVLGHIAWDCEKYLEGEWGKETDLQYGPWLREVSGVSTLGQALLGGGGSRRPGGGAEMGGGRGYSGGGGGDL